MTPVRSETSNSPFWFIRRETKRLPVGHAWIGARCRTSWGTSGATLGVGMLTLSRMIRNINAMKGTESVFFGAFLKRLIVLELVFEEQDFHRDVVDHPLPSRLAVIWASLE